MHAKVNTQNHAILKERNNMYECLEGHNIHFSPPKKHFVHQCHSKIKSFQIIFMVTGGFQKNPDCLISLGQLC